MPGLNLIRPASVSRNDRIQSLCAGLPDVSEELPHHSGYETAVYVRMSTHKTAMSEDAQVTACTEYHEREGDLPTLRRIFVDESVSGMKPIMKRPAARKMISYLRRGDHLTVAAFDRLGRNSLDSLTVIRGLVEGGVTVHILNMPFLRKIDPNDLTARMMLAQYATFAEFEWNSISRRFDTSRMSALWRGYGNYEGSVPMFFDMRRNPHEHDPTHPSHGCTMKYVFREDVYDTYDEIWRRYNEGWSEKEIMKALNNGGHRRWRRRDDGTAVRTNMRYVSSDVRDILRVAKVCNRINMWVPH